MSWSADFQKGYDAYQSGDYATALREWQPLAEQGNADAQYELGWMYRSGKGVPQDYKTAFKWYTLAAEQGHAAAQIQGAQLQKKIAAAEKAAAEKKAAEKKAAEKKAAEKKAAEKKAAEKKAAEKKELDAREKLSASNPGFRDLRPGLHLSTIKKLKVCEGYLKSKSGTACYGLQNLTFIFKFDTYSFLEKLTVDLGPIVQMGGFIDQLSTYVTKGETNIYLKMRNTLGEKYKIDFEFSERDRQLFNEDSKDKLYSVYHGGQVALLINWKKRDYSKDLWLYIEYRDVKPAQIFLESTKPKRATSSDF
jgi:hypothetical protein